MAARGDLAIVGSEGCKDFGLLPLRAFGECGVVGLVKQP